VQSMFTELQLDALQELSNIGSGTAATSLSQLLGRTVDVSVPSVTALPLADAVDAAGDPEDEVTAVLVPVHGELDTMVLLMLGADEAEFLCGQLGVARESEFGRSALAEIGNILTASYLGGVMTMTGLVLLQRPPLLSVDFLAAILGTVLASGASATDIALLIDSKLSVEGSEITFTFLFMLSPDPSGAGEILLRLGLGT